MPDTFTVRITFNRAQNLPVADVGTLSCDPFILAKVSTPEHLDLEPLSFRTPTIRRTRQPTWDASWVVAGVPETGFKLRMILYDEDPGAKMYPDRLGKATARFGREQMKAGWESTEREYVLQKRKGDLHPWLLTYFTALLPGQKLLKHNRVVVSVQVLRKDGRTKERSRMYTLGPNRYSRHFSPLIGSMINKKPQSDSPDNDKPKDGKGQPLSATTFVANKLQLTGPPPDIRHRYVGYKPFIDWMFADSGIAGHLLHFSLRKQYRTIYACDKRTVWGVVEGGVNRSNADGDGEQEQEEGDTKDSKGETNDSKSETKDSKTHDVEPGKATPESTEALARQFLEMTSWGEGNKLFTYVITLDSEWRFTETGPEFAIDLLSKHSMHANLAKEIVYSGEFFVQRLSDGDGDGDRNPKSYELIIDNDSGTYRPKKELLPQFEAWLADDLRLGGLGRVRTMDGFDEELEGMKKERQEAKAKGSKEAGRPERMVPVRMGSDGASSISSGDLGEGRASVSSERVDEVLGEMNGKKEGEGKEEKR